MKVVALLGLAGWFFVELFRILPAWPALQLFAAAPVGWGRSRLHAGGIRIRCLGESPVRIGAPGETQEHKAEERHSRKPSHRRRRRASGGPPSGEPPVQVFNLSIVVGALLP